MDLLLIIQIVHTLIAAWNYFSLLYIIYCHAASLNGRLLHVCYVTVLVEAIAIIPFGFTCPFRLVVDRYYSTRHDDILVPVPYSTWIMPVGIALFVVGQAIWIYKRLSQKHRANALSQRAPQTTRDS